MNTKRFSGSLVRRLLVGLPAVVLMLSGCADDSTTGGDSSNPTPNNPDPNNPDPNNPDPNTPEVEPLYALGSLVFSADFSSQTNYVKFTSALTAEGAVDESKTIEAVAEGSLYGVDNAGEFFLAGGETGEITKYTVSDDGKITEDSKVAFGAYGVTAFRVPVIQFISETKAYLWDDLTFKAFVWDPSSMTIVKDMDLSDLFDNEENGTLYWTWRERVPNRVGNKIYIGFHYFDPATSTSLPNSGVLVINTETDEFTVVKHSTCPGFHNSMLGPDGYIYYASAGHAAASHKAGAAGQAAPCLARLDPETDQWDDTYEVDLTEATGGKAAAGIIHNEGSFAYVKVLNDELLPEGTPMDSIQAISSSNAWELHRIDVTDPAGTLTRVDVPPASSTVYSVLTDGHLYSTAVDFRNSRTTFLDVSKNPPEVGFVGPGWITVALRLK